MAFQENDKYSNTEDEDIYLDFDDDDDDDSGDGESAPAWLASYSDMMTDLMAIFVILFAFAAMVTSSENKNIKEELQNIKSQTTASQGIIDTEIDNEFDEIYELIKKKIEQSGYSDSILLEKTQEYIKFKFKDNVLFYPDSPVMRPTSYSILQYMGDLLLSIDSNIGSIDISGHTAKVNEESKTNFFAWELSSDRSIAVLKFFVSKCNLPQSKMVVSGYSHFQPISDNDKEVDMSLNRRVEIKIVKVTPKS